MRTLTSLAGLATIVLLVATACAGDDGGGKLSPLESVPADITLLASIQIKQAVEDLDLRSLFEEVGAADELDVSSLEEALAKLEELIGVNPAQIDELLLVGSQELLEGDTGSAVPQGPPPRPVVLTEGPAGTVVPRSSVAGTPAPRVIEVEGAPPRRVVESRSVVREEGPNLGGPPEGLLVFVKGSYDPDLVRAAFQRQSEEPLRTSIYNGQELIIGEEDAALAFLQDDLVVIGSEPSVQSVIDVRAGDKPDLEGDFLDSFRAMGSPLVKMLFAVPKEALDELDLEDTENLPIQIDPSIFQVESFGLVLDKSGDQITLNITVDYPDITSARKARDAFTGLVAFLKAFIVGGEIGDLLQKLEVSFSGSQLRIDFSLTTEELKDAIETLQSPGAGAGLPESRNTELKTIQTAVTAAMADNNLTTISPVTATDDMSVFPDTTTVVGASSLGAGSVTGLRLYDHDSEQGNTSSGPKIRYATQKATRCKYLAQSDGTVEFAGKADNTVGTLDQSRADCYGN